MIFLAIVQIYPMCIRDVISTAHFFANSLFIFLPNQCSYFSEFIEGQFPRNFQEMGTQNANMPISQDSCPEPFGSVRICSASPS